jgi:hypothetical protein
MPVQFILTLRGHPWDLWGLSKIFDGTNTDHMLLKAEEPKGRPIVDFSDRAQLDRFQKLGYDIFAPLTCDSLLHNEAAGPPDIQKMKVIAHDIISRINGIGRLIEPDYWPVSYYTLSYTSPGGGGFASPDGTTPNKQHTSLGWHHTHASFADRVFELSRTEPAVRFILDAIAIRSTWVSLYLIYETIKDNVGDQKALASKNWVSPQELSDFRYAANYSRSLIEGMRHATSIQALPKPPIPLHQAHNIIDRLSKRWLESLT